MKQVESEIDLNTQTSHHRRVEQLTSAQRKYLRGLAHGLKPLVHIGKLGLSDSLFENLTETLEHHELIKVKFVDFKDEKKALCQEISDRLDCETVGIIGHIGIFFRPARQPEHRQIKLPKG